VSFSHIPHALEKTRTQILGLVETQGPGRIHLGTVISELLKLAAGGQEMRATLENVSMPDRPAQDQPLLHARRPVGRPKKSPAKQPAPACKLACVSVASVPPRLLDLDATAAYLGLSPWTVRELESRGILHRVRVPLPTGELRKLLFDREDLDRLIEGWKDR
jgi:hypothetical protein